MRSDPRTQDADVAPSTVAPSTVAPSTVTPSTVAPSTEQLAAQGASRAGADRSNADVDGGVLFDDAPTVESTRPAQVSGPQMTVTQAIRLNRSKRRTIPPGTPARIATPAPQRSAWKDGLFPAVFGAIFSARWVIEWVRDGQLVLAAVVGIAATAGLFAVGVGASRWLAEPAADAGDR